MTKIDAVYTPDWLADELVQLIGSDFSGTIVDPCAGEGALLAAAERRLGSTVSLLGIDIRPEAIGAIAAQHPTWTLSCGDTLEPRSVSATKVVRSLGKSADLILLNPPFSVRGHTTVRGVYDGEEHAVTPPLAFVLASLTHFSPRAGMIAILPTGSIFGERSRVIWARLELDYAITIGKELHNGIFAGVHASTRIVQLTPRRKSSAIALQPLPTHYPCRATCNCLEIVRGRVPRHRAIQVDTGVPYVHTTDLERIAELGRHATPILPHVANRLASDGPLVMIGRVGAYRRPVEVSESVVLSDCLFGLRPVDRESSHRLMTQLRAREEELRSLYTGTGAPYLTLDRLIAWLNRLGWNARHVPASAPIEGCQSGAQPLPAAPLRAVFST